MIQIHTALQPIQWSILILLCATGCHDSRSANRLDPRSHRTAKRLLAIISHDPEPCPSDYKHAFGSDWLTLEEVLSCRSVQPDARAPVFTLPQQLMQSNGWALRSLDDPIPVISVHFNRAAANHICGKGPYNVFKINTEDALNEALGKNSGVRVSSIIAFSNDAMTLKAVWWPVDLDQGSLLPVWDGFTKEEKESGVIDPRNPAELSQWPRKVMLVPEWEVHNDSHSAATLDDVRRVPLSRIFHVAMKQESWDREPYASALFRSVLGREPDDRSGLALVAFHIASKQRPDWVWATYWWHDKPHSRGLHRDERWRYYRADVSVNADRPRERDGSQNICFNPYLEGAMYHGRLSNCLACHQWASYPPPTITASQRGAVDPFNSVFGSRIRTDYVWALGLIGNR